MKRLLTYILFTLFPIATMPQRLIFESDDSIRIENILHRMAQTETAATGQRLIDIAEMFLGEKYVSGTLESSIDEPLFISCTKLDCTTFVELVLAIAKTANDGNCKFSDVCSNLETIRYRNGKNCGYASRLHYISWWIDDNARKGILKDVTPLISSEKQILNLTFMSEHTSNYPLLEKSPELIKEIETQEMLFRGIETEYIPKENLNSNTSKEIKNGDIIAITTSIPGLDVTHVGFAYYNNGELCLHHASSGRGMVVKEAQSLREYLAGKKQHTGIRVFRATF